MQPDGDGDALVRPDSDGDALTQVDADSEALILLDKDSDSRELPDCDFDGERLPDDDPETELQLEGDAEGRVEALLVPVTLLVGEGGRGGAGGTVSDAEAHCDEDALANCDADGLDVSELLRQPEDDCDTVRHPDEVLVGRSEKERVLEKRFVAETVTHCEGRALGDVEMDALDDSDELR